ncbi:hypothetical protein OPV22_027193 [Ensete ventricosum]|uniref:Uncharacterized protein n=1 Tax=Ensete ventricosum TaxID=4639 RepID=A0AAV8P3Y6_ENSVE|nr:hypothetical protein OPV22_027193 [Ensete ventricosum]
MGVGRGEESEEITRVADTLHVPCRPRRRHDPVASTFGTAVGARDRWFPPPPPPVVDALRHGLTEGGKKMRRIPQGAGDRKWVAYRRVADEEWALCSRITEPSCINLHEMAEIGGLS